LRQHSRRKCKPIDPKIQEILERFPQVAIVIYQFERTLAFTRAWRMPQRISGASKMLLSLIK